MKPSDIFEGEDSGLIKAFNEAVFREKEKYDCSLYHPVGNLCSNPDCTGGLGVSEKPTITLTDEELLAECERRAISNKIVK